MGQRIFILGVLALLIGIQLRGVESFVLTQKASTFIEQKVRQTRADQADPYGSLLMTAGPVPKKTIRPPRWLGWAMLSVGAVLVLHGLTSRRQ